MAALAGGQPRAPAGSPASSSGLLKLQEALGFPRGSLSLSVAQFHQLICVQNRKGIRMDKKSPASLKEYFTPKKSKIKANGTFLSLVPTEHPLTLMEQPRRILLCS